MKSKSVRWLALCAGLACLSAAPASAASASKPNIVVIVGDDIGITNIGVYGHGMMAGKTPALDKIAREGTFRHSESNEQEL